MKLAIREIWDDSGASYFIEDQETGAWDVNDLNWASKSEAQAYLDTHREEIERKGLPPLSPEDVASYWRIVEIMEKKLDEGELQIGNDGGNPRFLLRLARQPVLLEEASLRRLESVIARFNIAAENARATAAKSVLDAQETKSRLNLACAYLELGDRDAALCMLDEVVRQGDDVYKERARKMIGEISGKTN